MFISRSQDILQHFQQAVTVDFAHENHLGWSGLSEGPALGTSKQEEDTEDRGGQEAGNSPHFLRQDTVFL